MGAAAGSSGPVAADAAQALLGGAAESTEAAGGSAAAVLQQTLLWQYRWAASPEQVHGPFDSVTMQGWSSVGAFSEERPAEIRQCDSANEPRETCWHSWDQIDFS